ncbi:hypothetical protein L195_g054254, partial [Trifolium pratense]
DGAQVTTILWSIWKQCNNKVWNNTVDTQSHVINCVEELICDWAAVRIVQNRATEVQPDAVMNRWNKRLPGRFKCNIDATFTRDKWSSFSPKCNVHVGEALCSPICSYLDSSI